MAYTAKNDKDVSLTILRMKQQGMSLRRIAKVYGNPVNHADIQRILHGQFMMDNRKRIALGLKLMCPYCKRKVGERRKRKDLFSTSPKELKWMFENRQEIECSSDVNIAQEDVTDSPNGMESMAV